MKISKNDLTTALEAVKPGLSAKELITQTTAFAFVEGNVVTYNDSISLSHPVANLNITGAVEATELYQLLKKLKTDEIDITQHDSEIILKSGKTTAGLRLETEIKLPLKEVERKSKWHAVPENLKTALAFAYTSCSRDLTKPVLTCVHVDREGYVEGCDNYRIARFTLGEELPVDSFLLPQKSVVELLKIEPVKMALDKAWVHFVTEDKTVMSCRLIDEKFPDTGKLLNIEGEEFELPEGIEEILDRASVFAKRDSAMEEDVTVCITKGNTRVESKSDTGWFKEDAPNSYRGEELRFDITPLLLKSILKQSSTFQHCGRMLKFSGESWQYVVSLRGV